MMGYDALNLGESDLKAGLESFAKPPFISTNIGATETAGPSFTPCVIKELAGFRVGIFGLSAPFGLQPSYLSQNPFESAKKMVEFLAPKCSLIICLSNLALEENKRLAREVQGIDLVIGGHADPPLSQPICVGETLIFYAGSHGQYIGRIDLAIQDVKKPYKFSSLHLRSLVTSGLQDLERQIQELTERGSAGSPWGLSELAERKEKLRDRLEGLVGKNTHQSSLVPLDAQWEDEPAIRLLIEAFKRQYPANP